MTKLSPAETVPEAPSRCCAPFCANRSDNTDGVCFFRFPKDEERCKKWVANCGRADLKDEPAENLFASHWLCSAHFKKGCFSSRYRNRLVWNAVPTVFKHAGKALAAKATVKPLRVGMSKGQQRFRRFFGFASKRRTSIQLRPGAPLRPAPLCPLQQKKDVRKESVPAPVAKVVEVESPRLPVYIEDHLYAAPTDVQPVFSTRFSLPSAAQSNMSRVHEIIVDHMDGDRLVMDVVEGGSLMDAKDAEAFKAAVEAALPLLQLSQQIPLGPPPPRLMLTTTTTPSASSTMTVYSQQPKEEPREVVHVGPGEPSEAASPRRRGPCKTSRKGPRMMQDFLLPHLDKGTFGQRLQWVDRTNGVFQIGWYHKSAAQWTKDDCVVFLEWDRLKKRPVAQNPHYWMEAKQRFRAALGKVTYGWAQPHCKATASEIKNVKVRKIKWTRDMQPPLGSNWEPWDPNWGNVTQGRVHRPTISHVRRQSPPPYVELTGEPEEEDEADAWSAQGDPCVCHRCGYTTRNRRVFLRHRMMHRDVRAFCCRYCPQRFCLPESLFLHLQVHSETYPYSCSSCGVETRLLLQLWRHELRRLAQRLCLCHRCGLVCHVRENLKYHMAKAHGQGYVPPPNPNWELAPLCSAELGRRVVSKPNGSRAKPANGQKPSVRKPKSTKPKAGKPKVCKPKADKPKPAKSKAAEKSGSGKPKSGKPKVVKIGAAKSAAKKAVAGKNGANKPPDEKAANHQQALGKVVARKSVAVKSEPHTPEAKLASTSKPATGKSVAVGDESKGNALGTGEWENGEQPEANRLKDDGCPIRPDSGQSETIELIINELRKSEPSGKKRKADDAPVAQDWPKKKAMVAALVPTSHPPAPPPMVLKVPTQTNHAGVVLAGMVTEDGLRRTQRIRTPKRKISA